MNCSGPIILIKKIKEIIFAALLLDAIKRN